MEWLKEQLDLLNHGGGMVIAALCRLGLVGLGLWFAYGMLRTFFANPVKVGRGVIAVAAGLVVSVGTVILVPKYVYPVGGFGLLVLGYLAWVAGWKVTSLIFGEDDPPTTPTDTPPNPSQL